MFELSVPATRRDLFEDYKGAHENIESVVEVVSNVMFDLLDGLWHLTWRHARRLRLIRAYRLAKQVTDLHELILGFHEDTGPIQSHFTANILLLSIPHWVYPLLGENTRNEVLAVADYTGWAITP
ncbi:hypothetical protein LG293_16950 (plasmid) [Citricoccus nitrophenolicus]